MGERRCLDESLVQRELERRFIHERYLARRRLLVLAIPCLLPAGACATPQGAMSRAYGGVNLPLTAIESGPAEERSELSAQLALGAPMTDSGQVAGPGQTTIAGSVRLRIRSDGALEYTLKLRNPGRTNYVAARLVKGDDLFAGEPVATLFSGTNLRDRQIQVRGTAEMSRAYGPGELAEELRRAPILFYVMVEPGGEPTRSLRGRLR